jgi:sodium transport system permease protein
MSLRHVWIMLEKELTCTLRDRSAMLRFLLIPILSPLVYGLILSLLASRVGHESNLVLPVAGADNAPALIDWLGGQTGVTIVGAPADPEAAVRAAQRDGVLLIGRDYRARLIGGRPATLTLVSDGERGESARFAARVRELVARYGAELTGARLSLRGIDPSIATPLKLDDIDISTARARNGGVLAFLPMLLAWVALAAGMPLALDSTAGERERASLEPLLLHPISGTSVIAGKWLAAAALACLGLLLAAGSSILFLRLVPWHELGMQMRVSDTSVWASTLVMLPVALLMSSAVMLASALSRSFQQAQTFASVLMIVALVPGILTMVLPGSTAAWQTALPVVGQLLTARDLLAGGAPALARHVLAVTVTVIPALLLVALSARLASREAILFRGD